jgi:hypothetical protein
MVNATVCETIQIISLITSAIAMCIQYKHGPHCHSTISYIPVVALHARITLEIPLTKLFARLMCPAKSVKRQARSAHKECTIELSPTLQSVLASASKIASRAAAPTCSEHSERTHCLGQVLLRVRDGVRNDALPWSSRGTERLALGIGRGWNGWRGSEPIIGSSIELLDGHRAISS